MNRLKINIIVDTILFVVLAINIFAAVSRIRDLHKITGWVFFALVILHLLLHFRQIVAMMKSFFGKQST